MHLGNPCAVYQAGSPFSTCLSIPSKSSDKCLKHFFPLHIHNYWFILHSSFFQLSQCRSQTPCSVVPQLPQEFTWKSGISFVTSYSFGTGANLSNGLQATVSSSAISYLSSFVMLVWLAAGPDCLSLFTLSTLKSKSLLTDTSVEGCSSDLSFPPPKRPQWRTVSIFQCKELTGIFCYPFNLTNTSPDFGNPLLPPRLQQVSWWPLLLRTVRCRRTEQNWGLEKAFSAFTFSRWAQVISWPTEELHENSSFNLAFAASWDTLNQPCMKEAVLYHQLIFPTSPWWPGLEMKQTENRSFLESLRSPMELSISLETFSP